MSHDAAPDLGQPSPAPPPVPAAAPPPLPPPVPPFGLVEPESAAEPADSTPEFQIDTRRSSRGRPRGDGGMGVLLSLLLVAAAAMLAYVAWPKLAPHLKPQLAPIGREPSPESLPAEPPRPEAAVATRSTPEPPTPEPAAPVPAAPVPAAPVPDAATALAGAPRRDDAPRATEPPAPAADREATAGSPFDEPRQPVPPPSPAPIDAAAAPRPPEAPTAGASANLPAVDAAIRAAVRALRSEDWAAAGDRLDAAEAAAGDDADAIDRVTRWRRLLLYAEGFGPLRAQALAASVGNEYTVDGKVISIVEANDTNFVFRRLGRNVSKSVREIPRAIVVAIVSQWFANADRPANHLYLGAYHACREDPNVQGARSAWRTASREGEADGDRLLPLLDDPALADAAP